MIFDEILFGLRMCFHYRVKYQTVQIPGGGFMQEVRRREEEKVPDVLPQFGLGSYLYRTREGPHGDEN